MTVLCQTQFLESSSRCSTPAGVCPLEEVFCDGEQHIWEHRFNAFGFFGDPFNYSGWD